LLSPIPARKAVAAAGASPSAKSSTLDRAYDSRRGDESTERRFGEMRAPSRALKRALRAKGVAARHIHFENFEFR
jgi:hypothetical protein